MTTTTKGERPRRPTMPPADFRQLVAAPPEDPALALDQQPQTTRACPMGLLPRIRPSSMTMTLRTRHVTSTNFRA